ncbi:hypothetical protein MC885_020328, partial [Smutsia gigantea]
VALWGPGWEAGLPAFEGALPARPGSRGIAVGRPRSRRRVPGAALGLPRGSRVRRRVALRSKSRKSTARRGPHPWDSGMTAQDLIFRGGLQFRRQPHVVLDVTEQLSRFLWDHGDIAFAPLGKLMLENFKLEGARVSLGLPQLPTTPVLHPRGPDPGHIRGEPPGRTAARGAGSAMGAAAPG